MDRPSKKDIKAALDKLRDQKPGVDKPQPVVPKLEGKKSNMRIRKQGV